MQLKVKSQRILSGTYRLNPSIRLIEHGSISAETEQPLKRLADNPSHFGVLLSDSIPELGVQSIDKDAARLFNRLKLPSKIAHYIDDPIKIAIFVLDGILEVEHKDAYLSGPAAFPVLLGGQATAVSNHITRLSLEAIQLAQKLTTTDAKQISAWLYRFNRIPMSVKWATLLETPQHVEQFLGIENNRPLRFKIDKHYVAYQVPGWRAWRHWEKVDIADDDMPTYKLYISPHLCDLPKVFAIAVNHFIENDVVSFKLGRDTVGLLRSDKLIAYFSSQCALMAVAEKLSGHLQQFTPQSVPFTAQVDAQGILSWGSDPPRKEAIPGWQEQISWRSWITDRLARSLLLGRIPGSGSITPWQFAVSRLALDGVDTTQWMPICTA